MRESDPQAQPAIPSLPSRMSRRAWLQRSGTAAAGLWMPLDRVQAGWLGGQEPPPEGFPSDLSLYRQRYINWSRDIVVDQVWTCAPRHTAELLSLVNWAAQHGWRVRPRGMMHNWSPLTLAPGAAPQRVVLVDTTQHFTAVRVNAQAHPPRVTAQAGLTLEALLTELERHGLGMLSTPAPGDITLGGLLAIDGHGTGIPAQGEQRQTGHTYGTLSNQILALTAVVFDGASGRYVLRTFQRHDPAIAPLLAHVGRAFIVEVTLQAGQNQRLRCQSIMDVPWRELFGPQAHQGRTLASYLERSGRVEAIWFPFTPMPWLKVWSVCTNKPPASREVQGPFNYPFSDNLPTVVSDMGRAVLHGFSFLSPLFGQVQAGLVYKGLTVTASWDLWGWSKNLLLYVKPTTLRVTANGYAVLTRRDQVQTIVHDFAREYQQRLDAWRRRFRYPMNGPVEIRITGLDHTSDVDVPGAVEPCLSAARPRADRPDWDVAVWFDLLTMPGTPHAVAFYREFEQWMLQRFNGHDSAMRVEWSKGWGYSERSAWDDAPMLTRQVPDSLTHGVQGGGFDEARRALNAWDPRRVFSSPLLENLLP